MLLDMTDLSIHAFLSLLIVSSQNWFQKNLRRSGEENVLSTVHKFFTSSVDLPFRNLYSLILSLPQILILFQVLTKLEHGENPPDPETTSLPILDPSLIVALGKF